MSETPETSGPENKVDYSAPCTDDQFKQVDAKLDRIIAMLEVRAASNQPKATIAEVSAVLHWFSVRGSDQGLTRSPELSRSWSDDAEEFVGTALSQGLQVRYRHLEKVHVYPDKEIQRQKLLVARVSWIFDLLKTGLTEASISHVCTSSQLKKWLDQI